MFIIIAITFSGVVAGYLCRGYSSKYLPHIITSLIWILLFILGIEVGSNREIVTNLHSLGVEALIISLFSTLGSVLCAMLLWRWAERKRRA